MADVERGGRLVEQQQRGALGKRANEEHPLPLAVGERSVRPGIATGLIRQLVVGRLRLRWPAPGRAS
jgi:hypothetical protein